MCSCALCGAPDANFKISGNPDSFCDVCAHPGADCELPSVDVVSKHCTAAKCEHENCH